MALKAKKLSLAEKISSLVTAAPTVFGSDDENEETKAKVVDRYDESESEDDAVGSAFRKRNVNLLDEVDNRYKGKKVSRKDVFGVDDESEASELEDTEDISDDGDDDISEDSEALDKASEDEEASDDVDSQSEKSEQNIEIDSEAEESNSDADGDSEIDEENPLRRERRQDANIENMTETNVRADVEKGNCVREQLKIWENLLEMRIKLQKCLIVSNKMPQSETHKDLKSDDKFKKETNDCTKKLSGLLENLLEMQSNLLGNYPETKTLRSRGKKRKAGETEKTESEDPMDEEIPSDTEDEEEKEEEEDAEESSEEQEAKGQPEKKKKRCLAEYERILAENHNIYRDYRNSVVQKWNDKTRVATGSVNKGSSQAVVKQIEFVLSDKSKLLKRTQLKRSEYDVVGKIAIEDEDGRRTQEFDPEIYDDDDFYHQLLRELIEHKSSDITDPIQLSKQWIQLQNMRNKMKRKIDTRATKGRRVRYNVHTKLVNFMAPVNVNDRWSDLAKNELYNSLFGKIKSEETETTNEGVSERL